MAAQSLLSLSQVLTQTTVTVRYNEYTGTISHHQSYVQQRQPPKSTAQLPSITSLAEDPFTMSASDSMKAWTVTEEELAAVQKSSRLVCDVDCILQLLGSSAGTHLATATCSYL